MKQVARGTIITFYSFKGGTGRSMALANTACLLTQNADEMPKVLAIDWDLEAPGLSRYFPPSATNADENDDEAFDQLRDHEGLIEYFVRLRATLKTDPTIYARFEQEFGPDLLDVALPVSEYILGGVAPGVDLLTAGKACLGYAQAVAEFDWKTFFETYPEAIRVFREWLVAHYDYILVDSRTGFTDIAGICTTLLPEKLVGVFTPNWQSLIGLLDVVRAAVTYRLKSDDLRPFTVFPLPSRVDLSEKVLKDRWRDTYESKFESLFAELYGEEEVSLKAYFDSVELPHESFYAYGEKLAALEQRSTVISLKGACQRFFDRLMQLDVPWEPLGAIEVDGQRRCAYRGLGVGECKRPATQLDGLCVFHSNDPARQSSEFNTGVDAMLATGDLNFAGFRFPAGHSFVEVVFDNLADFSGAVFPSQADFRSCVFLGDAIFRSAAFNDADFRGARFNGSAYFNETTISDRIKFDEARVAGDLQFNRAVIQGPASFTRADCGSMNFAWAKLLSFGDFRQCSVGSAAVFCGYPLQRSSRLHRCQFQENRGL